MDTILETAKTWLSDFFDTDVKSEVQKRPAALRPIDQPDFVN